MFEVLFLGGLAYAGYNYTSKLSVSTIKELGTTVENKFAQFLENVGLNHAETQPSSQTEVVPNTGNVTREPIATMVAQEARSQTNPAPGHGQIETTPNTGSVMREQVATMMGQHTQLEASEEVASERREMVAITAAVALSLGSFFYWPLGLLSVPFILYASKDYHLRTYELAKQHKVNVNTIMSLTIIGAAFMGRFFIASMFLFLRKLAARMTSRVTQTAKYQLTEAFTQHPNFVWVVVEGTEIRIPFSQLQVGDVVVVNAGEVIPADGTVINGSASVDQHVLTGEARPVEKWPGEIVFASTVVLSGKIQFAVEKTGEESTVAKITQILNHTIEYKSTTQLRVETISQQLVKPILIGGGVVLPFLGFESAVAMLSVHPKEKIMIIAPLSILNYLNIASQQGVLIKDARSLELLHEVDTVVFDKTGTLTEEQPQIGTIHCCSSYTENEVLTYAATAEYKQKHPLAKAILQEAKRRQLTLPEIDDSTYRAGYGLMVVVAGQTVQVGSERFMKMEGMTIPSTLKQQQQFCHDQGYTLVMVAVEQQVIGAIELLPTVRPEMKAIIERLKQHHGIKTTYIISGDHETPTRKLAEELGVDHYFAQTLPEQKATIIEQLQQQGHIICYIGDGINDAIALKKSHVSISLRGASTIATDTAQIVLMDQGLQQLDFLFGLAKEFKTHMDTSFALVITPAIIGIGGALLFGFGLPETIALNMSGLFLGTGNAMLPLWKHSSNFTALLPSSVVPKITEH